MQSPAPRTPTISGRAPRVVVGIGGGIAAYKTVLLVRELLRRGVETRVVMTKRAQEFVGPVTLSGLTGRPAVTDLWDANYAGEVHVELGTWADVMVVAPATMNLLARYAHGHADDALLATLACFDGPVVMAPAMHTKMWNQASTRQNIDTLRRRGVVVVGPEEGPLASGETGVGRMSEPETIAAGVEDALRRLAPGESPSVRGRHIVVSAGPTHEDLDPVRFIGNRSTGKMGFALAEQAARRGASVTLVAGPVVLETPIGVSRIDVRSAIDMQEAIDAAAQSADVVIMAAAVADYRPSEVSEKKRKKSPGTLTLELQRNPDILLGLGEARRVAQADRPYLVGFALETEALEEHARGKLARKHVDLIVGNYAKDSFGREDNRAILVSKDGTQALEQMSKTDLAAAILDHIAEALPKS